MLEEIGRNIVITKAGNQRIGGRKMPRPIIMTEEMKQKARADFNEILDEIKMSDGKLIYNRVFKYENKSATVWLTQESYRKIVALVTNFSSEVGWHGTVSRAADNEFIIENIFVYPQEVTGSTVNTDQKLYTEWLYSLDDDAFNKIRMQGHSHCSMGVSPSGVDDTHRQHILNQLEPDMFYIFQIWNKSLAVHTLVYDMAQNILYEDDDVEIKLQNDEGMDEFLEDALEKVKKPVAKKNKSASKKQNAEQIELDDDYFDYEDYDFRMTRGLYHRFYCEGS
jgi:hypothetical protein